VDFPSVKSLQNFGNIWQKVGMVPKNFFVLLSEEGESLGNSFLA